MSTALYRRYRPETFAEMIGQSQVTDPLMTALRSDRIGHAYLFSGPRGCGKTTSARILARCLNCAEGPTDTPCGTCDSCVELSRDGGGSLDVVEIDAASHNGVDDARDLRERAVFAPARDRYKIFILDEAHMVTPQGFNALLKLVEEPPPHVKFVFATTEPEKVIGTIRSRTHHYPFRLVPPASMLEYVEQLCGQENIAPEPGVLPLVVRAGAGSPRDTLSILDQLIAGSEGQSVSYARAVALLGYTHGELLDDVAIAFAARDAAAAFGAVDRVVQTGQDPRRFVDDLLERLRDLIVIAATGSQAATVLRGLPADELERMQAQAAAYGSARLSRAADIVSTALDQMTGATSPRLQLELMIARVLTADAEDADDAAAPAARPGAMTPGAARTDAPAATPPSGPAAAPEAASPSAGTPVPPASAPPAAAPSASPVAEPAPAASMPPAAAPVADPSDMGPASAVAEPAAVPGAHGRGDDAAEPAADAGETASATAPPAVAPPTVVAPPSAAPPVVEQAAAAAPGAHGRGDDAAEPAASAAVAPPTAAAPHAATPPAADESEPADPPAHPVDEETVPAADEAGPVEPAAPPAPAAPSAPDESAPTAPAGPPESDDVPAAAWATPGAPQPTAELTLASLQRDWSRVLETVQQSSRASWLTLQSASPVHLAGDVVGLVFTNQADLGQFKNRAPDGSGVSADLRAAIAEVTDFTVKFLAKHVPAAGAPAAPSASAAPAAPRTDEPASHPEPAAEPTPPPASYAAAPATGWAVAPIPNADAPDPDPEPAAPEQPEAPSAAAPSAPAGQAAPPASAPSAAPAAAQPPAAAAAPTHAAPPPFAAPEPDMPADDDVPPDPYDDPYPPEERAPAGPTVQRRQVHLEEGVQRYGEAVVRQKLGAVFLHEEEYTPPTRFQ